MTPSLIIDCSLTMAWCFGDETTVEITKIQERLISEAVAVPPIWKLEVTNVLAMAEKRHRISVADSTQFVQLLASFDIQIDFDCLSQEFDHVLPLARAHGITTYDASYLELALRRKLPLATLDDELRTAATALGLEVLGK
ncbi:MAG: type II toxin-antitoxin system VapC family toxin [Planctomycetota bacterium]|nr:type II toxin-antitoxin system VapC family toxin [Planctomycetota bacterium]MDA1213908.1 type II toxin-antitoxin system VapC family toxin [Planctomycetota bacterium]